MNNKTNTFTLITISLLTVGLLLLSLPKDQERYASLTAQLLPKTVTIVVKVSRINPRTKMKESGGFIGSGVFVSPQGHILTCAHLFDNDYKIESINIERSNGWTYSAILVYKDSHKDLSLLKIEETNTPFAVLEDPRNVKEGQEVIAIGSPLGLNGTVTTGIISATHRDSPQYDMIQMSAAINPGNSGGPLFNLNGKLVGINVSVLSTNPFFFVWTGLGFSVSASEINKFLAVFPDKETVGRLTWR